MKMAIVVSYQKAVQLAKKFKSKDKKVCLATGCFDAIHTGHIDLFRYAKKHCDYLIVGIDNDETIRLSKGEGRPIFSFQDRSNVLSELRSIDLIFKIEPVVNHGSKDAQQTYADITYAIRPDFLVTNPLADRFWKEKRQKANKIAAKLLLDKGKKRTSTTLVEQRIKSEI